MLRSSLNTELVRPSTNTQRREHMIGRRSVIGLAVLCALVVGAFAAAGASAEQRAYTCTPEAGVKDYATADQHCVTNIGSGGGRGHTLISTAGTKITGTNEKTASGT